MFIERKKEFSKATDAFIEQINVVINYSDELSMKIFVNKYLQYSKFDEYKIELVKLLFNYPKLIKHSTLFFNYIFLTQPIKPKKQLKLQLTEKDKEAGLQKFGEIKNKIGDKILKTINEKAEDNEILKEILIYIFELRILAYFDDCSKTKFVQKSDRELLLGLNFEYFKSAYTFINSQDYGKLKNLGMIFYFSFIRCYLTRLVNLQLKVLNEKRDLGDLNAINKYFSDIYNSNLGKMIILYIAKIFIVNGKKDYFLNDYLKDEQYNWKNSILSKNNKIQLYPIAHYENCKHLLFSFWSKNNNEKIKPDFIKQLEITDLYYLNNLSYNEMSYKMKEDDTLVESIIISKINEMKDDFGFDLNTNEKLKKLYSKISNLEFFNEPSIKSNLKLIFYMINLYIIGFVGIKKEFLFSFIYSENIPFLIKLMNLNDNIKAQIPFIESYYRVKILLEEKYKKNKIFLPAYICSCGKWYYIEKTLPIEEKICGCGEKIGGKNETLVERNNHFALYYDEEQKNHIDSGKENKNNNPGNIKGMLLNEFKQKYILDPLLRKCSKLKNILLNNGNELNDNNISKIFINFIFLCNIYIEYKVEILNDNEKKEELGDIDLLNTIKDLQDKIEKYLEKKGKHFNDFMNYFCDVYCTLLKSIDCLKNKTSFYGYIKNNINKDYEDQTFFNIETNILTLLSYDTNFKNENLKYLLTATKYPNIEELNNYIKGYFEHKNKRKPILDAFISNHSVNKEINKLKHIETINDFINTFAEMNWNEISREESEKKEIKNYLNKNEENNNEQSPLALQFEKFKESYNEITHVEPFNLTADQPVRTILNDKKSQTQIYKIYCHLIEIQNEFLKKAIFEYENMKKKKKIKSKIL